MVRQSAAFVAVLFLSVMYCPDATADPIGTNVTIGSQGLENAFPFGAGPSSGAEYHGSYQQIYLGRAFGKPLSIDQIAFTTSSPRTGTLSSSFSLHLGATSSSPLAPAASFAANRGAGLTEVFSGTVVVAAIGTAPFDFVIRLPVPFLYDPSRSNLLLEAFINDNSEGAHFFAAGNSFETGRVFNSAGTGETIAHGGFGLLTQFSGEHEQLVPTPEPATVMLLAGALLGICTSRRRACTAANG